MNIPAHIIFGGIAFALLFAVAIAVGIAHERRRKRELADAFDRLGGTIDLTPTPEVAEQAFRHVGLLRNLKAGSSGVRWCARVDIDGLPVRVLEHRYTTGSGKNRTTHYHTIAAIPCPDHWPALTLDHEHIFHKIADLIGRKDLQLDDPAFNARWRVKTDDENFAIVFLAPEVQALLMALPRWTRLRVGDGSMCLLQARRLPPGEIDGFVRAAADLWHTIPPELRDGPGGT